MYYLNLPNFITLLITLHFRVALHRVVPCLAKEFVNAQMVPFVLPVVLQISEEASNPDFVQYILPELKPVMKMTDPIQVSENQCHEMLQQYRTSIKSLRQSRTLFKLVQHGFITSLVKTDWHQTLNGENLATKTLEGVGVVVEQPIIQFFSSQEKLSYHKCCG